MPQQRVLRNDVFAAERNLARLAEQHGKDSWEYQEQLKKLAQLWHVLRMTHGQEDFIRELTS